MGLEKFAGGFAVLASIASFLFGAFDISLKILATFIVLDFITGLLVAAYFKEVSSRNGYKGIIKKSGIFIVIIIANLLDILTGTPLFRMPVVYFFIAIEGVSILENLGKIGVPIPEVLLNKLSQLKDKASDSPDSRKDSK